jgi:hypothetical protein
VRGNGRDSVLFYEDITVAINSIGLQLTGWQQADDEAIK